MGVRRGGTGIGADPALSGAPRSFELRYRPSGSWLAPLIGIAGLFLWSTSPDQEGIWIFGVIGGVILALFAVDTVITQWAARRVYLTASAPATAWAGDTVTTRVGVSGVRRPVGLRMASLRGSRPVLVSAPAEGELETPTLQRGVFPYAIFETIVYGPLGLAAVTRTDSVALPTPVVVGPLPRRERTADQSPTAGGRAVPDPTALSGIRPYQAGDTRRRVHWLQSARHGGLLVRDHERTSHETVELVVDLGTGGAAEGVAGRAAGRALDLLDARRPLVLVTHEYSGVKRAAVRTTDDVARRLAVAVEGPVARPDHPHEFIGPVVPR